MLKNLKKLSLIIFAVFLAFIPLISLAQSKPVQFTPQIEIPNSLLQGQVVSIDGEGKVVSDLLPRYVKAIYNYGLMIGGVLAAIVLMAGGVVWLTSGGDSGSVSKAKGLIFSSITGLFILFGSYLILNTINPELVKMKGIQMITPSNITPELICNDSLGEVKVVIEKKDGKETYVNKDSNEAINGKICAETERCIKKYVGGKDIWSCTEIGLIKCCQYEKQKTFGIVCQSITDGTDCPEKKHDGNLDKVYEGVICDYIFNNSGRYNCVRSATN